MKAKTYIPEGREGWWGGMDTRLRCTVDHKVIFAHKHDADRAAAKATNRGTRCTPTRASVVTGIRVGLG